MYGESYDALKAHTSANNVTLAILVIDINSVGMA